jgi:CBS domain containing-hemolysin-like protein
MFTFLCIVLILLLVLLVVVAAVRPIHSSMSLFELQRRSVQGDSAATATLQREGYLSDVISLQRIIVALLLVIFVVSSVATLGWVFGLTIAVIVALEYGAISRVHFVESVALKLYSRIEANLLRLIAKFPVVFTIIRSVPKDEGAVMTHLDSREELQHLVAESGTLLNSDERKLIVHSLTFGSQQVSSVMTPSSVIDTIKHTEFLGPLMLDELHKKGHSRLPVINGDIDHVIGILHLQSLLALDVKRSVTAEKAMEPRVFYIREDQNLQHALAAFLRTHHHLFIVVNEFRETVGLLSLEDVIEALLGRKIIDEFDAHDDLRAVALRNPHDNNEPTKHEDV